MTAPNRLEQILDAMTHEGRLTIDQADEVRRRVNEAPTEGAATVEPPTAHRRGPVPEILGYVGGALLLSAVLSLVAQEWENWGDWLRITVSGGAATAVYLTASVVSGIAGWRSGLRTHAASRRLVAVLAAIGVPLVALTVMSLERAVTGDKGTDIDSIIIGSAAFTAATLGAWWVRGVMTTLAVAAGTLWLSLSVATAVTRPDDHVAWLYPTLVLLVGVAWLLVAPRLLDAPLLSQAIGMAGLVIMLASQALETYSSEMPPTDIIIAMWLSRGLLVAIALVALIGFAMGWPWPFAAGGVAAGVFAALSIGQGALGWITGLFIAGLVLLALSGIMLALRRRHMRSGASTPHSPSPLDNT
jgi:hypothetical protein